MKYLETDINLRKGEFVLEAKFKLPLEGVTGIFGHSGCGKTSLLRSIAGLETAAQGQVRVGDQCWQDLNSALPVEQRRVGVVFQEPSLFPHLNVEGNLTYAADRAGKVTGNARRFEIEEIISLLDLQALRQREVTNLSGGERQRVALARALMSSPTLLLLDEPLSALDHAARQNLMQILRNVFQHIDIPVLYVSHSAEEIANLADNLVLMKSGRVTAFGSLSEVLGEVDGPLNAANEAFSVLNCSVRDQQLPYLTTVCSEAGQVLHIPRIEQENVTRIRLRIPARDVSLCLQQPQGSSILNILPAQVTAISKQLEQGSRLVKLDVGGDDLLARVSEHSMQQLGIREGEKLFAQIKSMALIS